MEVGGSIKIFHYYGNADTRVWAINENRKWNGQIKLIPTKKNRNGLHIQVVRPLIFTGPEAVNTCMCVRVKM